MQFAKQGNPQQVQAALSNMLKSGQITQDEVNNLYQEAASICKLFGFK